MQLGRNGGVMLAGAALGFFAGLAANPARKLAIQGLEATAGDWVEVLKAEHRQVEAALDLLVRTTDQEAAKRHGLLLKIAYALNKHAIQEENVVYPAIRKQDAEAAKQLISEHGDIKALLSELQYGLDKSSPQWLAAAQSLRETVMSHVREEEDEIFPRCRAALSAEANAALTKRMNWEGLKVA